MRLSKFCHEQLFFINYKYKLTHQNNHPIFILLIVFTVPSDFKAAIPKNSQNLSRVSEELVEKNLLICGEGSTFLDL